MSATTEQVMDGLKEQGVEPADACINPALDALKLDSDAFGEWVGMFNDVDETCTRQVEWLRQCSMIPADVVIHGYVWEVETMKLRRPHERLGEKVNTSKQTGARP